MTIIVEKENELSKDEIEQLFSSSDVMEKVIAARKAYFHGDKFAHTLLKSLDNEFYEVRAFAAKSLGKMQYQEAIPKIIPLLKDEVEEVRFSAAAALGYFQDKTLVKPLLETLSDHSRETRRLAMISLQHQKSEDLYQAIKSWLRQIKEEDYEMNTEEAIHRIDVTRGILETCTEFDFPWVKEILEFGLMSPDLEMIRLATISIGNRSDQEFTDRLLELHNHKDDDLRLAVVYALTQLEFENKLSLLLSFITDPYEFIRELLAKYLPREYPSNKIQSALDQFTDDEVWFVRASVASSLRAIEYLELLHQFLSDPSSSVRKEAIESLGTIPSERSKQMLTQHEEDDDLVRIALDNALQKLADI